MMKANGESVLAMDFDGDGRSDTTDAVALYETSEPATVMKYLRGSYKDIDKLYPVYDICGNKLDDSFYSFKNKKTGKIKSSDVFFTNDGMLMKYSYNLAEISFLGGRGYVPRIVVVDTNGPFKKPNKVGFDIFGFGVTKNASVIPFGSPVEGDSEAKYAAGGVGNITEYDLTTTYYATLGKWPDGTDYWKSNKYWCE